MVVGVVRVVLRGVVLAHERVGDQVHEQRHVAVVELPAELVEQAVVLDELAYDQETAHAETPADIRVRASPGEQFREVFREVVVRGHGPIRVQPAYPCTFRDGVAALRQVVPAVLVVDVDPAPDGLPRYPPRDIGHLHAHV